MTRGQDGSLRLSCMTLSFTTPRRFYPGALSSLLALFLVEAVEVLERIWRVLLIPRRVRWHQWRPVSRVRGYVSDQGFDCSSRLKREGSFRPLQFMDKPVTIPAYWLQVLYSVGAAMGPVFAMMNLQAPDAAAPGTSPVVSPQHLDAVNGVYLANQDL
jgi:hypothetical protein